MSVLTAGSWTWLTSTRIEEPLAGQRADALRAMNSKIEFTMTTLLEYKCSLETNHDTSGSACEFLARAGYCLKELHRRDLWPSTIATKKFSVLAFAKMLSSITNYNRPFNCSKCICYDSSPPLDVARTFHDAGSDMITGLERLCLGCTKQGKVTVQEGNCKAIIARNCREFQGEQGEDTSSRAAKKSRQC